MTGRDPHESGRAATPLELLFDLTFVVSFGIAGSESAHLIAEGHVASAIGGFLFAMFAISWAWINFSWFASAYDTDDWLFRVLTMVQMVGVVVVALGLPDLFESLDHGEAIDNRVMVLGYIVMRVALVLQWLRAARQDPERRPIALTYAGFIVVAQLGWIVVAFTQMELLGTLGLAALLWAVELAGPIVAEGKGMRLRIGTTPWHPHHIVERYGLLTIIALGEGVFGTIAATQAVIHERGWSGDVIVLVVAGIGLTFGLWWAYFTLPAAQILHRHPDRAFPWGYGHMLIFASIAATGSGLHVVGYLFEELSHIGEVGSVLAVAIPVAIFMLTLFAMHGWLLRAFDPFHVVLLIGTVALLLAAVLTAAAHAPIALSLVLVTLAPFVVVVGYETVGHRHEAVALQKQLA